MAKNNFPNKVNVDRKGLKNFFGPGKQNLMQGCNPRIRGAIRSFFSIENYGFMIISFLRNVLMINYSLLSRPFIKREKIYVNYMTLVSALVTESGMYQPKVRGSSTSRL